MLTFLQWEMIQALECIADAKALLLKKAERVLDTITFDGRNRNWNFNKFVGKLRESFTDLGDDNQLSEQRKVNKLMQAWQVQSLQHLRATVSATPAHENNFDACVYFLSEQLTSLQLMNGGPGRNVASTAKEEIDSNNNKLQELQVQIKSLQQKLNSKKGGKSSERFLPRRTGPTSVILLTFLPMCPRRSGMPCQRKRKKRPGRTGRARAYR